ncbi:hypothetical protein V2K54_25975 [Pseudomonas alliivorans]|nr:hypothetical protein [Pseudomonas alliivorans]
MKDLLSKTSRSVSNVAISAKEVFTDSVSGVEQTRRKAAISVESKALGVRDSAIDLATAISGSSVKIISGVTGTVTLLVDIGITVVAIVAPVPTVIGLALLWVMKAQLTHSDALIDKSVSDNRERKKLERVTGLLKKYGKIPETATLETELIRMVIDSKKGEVTGCVLAGEFHDRELSSMSDTDIERLMSFAPDADTKGIVEAYQSFRQAQASGESHECKIKP